MLIDRGAKIPIKDSIGFNLLKYVFSIYIIVAVIVTAVHMTTEYYNVKAMVRADLQLYQSTFEAPLADALWDLDEARVVTIAPGIVKLPSIVGLQVFDLEGNIIANLGLVSEPEAANSLAFESQLFNHRFDINYRKEGEDSAVGYAVFYSSSQVVIEKLKTGFALIIINAIVKTIALWVIFLLVVRPILIRPLETLSHAARALTLENIGDCAVDVGSSRRNEIKVLEQSFNNMALSLHASTRQLHTARDDLQLSNRQLELLLSCCQKLTASNDISTALHSAVAGIFKATPSLLPADTQLIFTAHNEDGVEGFFHFRQQLDADIGELSRAWGAGEFVLHQPELLQQQLDQGERDFESLLLGPQRHLQLPLWHDGRLLALLSFERKKSFELSEGERSFITTLLQSLIITLEGIAVRGGLQLAVAERTAALEGSKAQLEERAQQLEQALEYKAQFLANMSHEIRTPMNAIIGFSRRGLRDAQTEMGRDYFEKVNSAAASLLVVINDILDFSKIESGKLQMERIPCDLGQLVATAMAVVEPLIHGKGLQLLLDQRAEVAVELLADPVRLQQVLINLLSNAAKFTESGHILLRLEQGERIGDLQELLFSVADTGVGIAEDKLDHIFDAFSQADVSTTRHYGGAGLGLAICRQLVTLMDGEISVDSSLGQGSCFHFNAYLKLPQPMSETPSLRAQIQPATASVIGGSQQEQQLLQQLLNSLGLQADFLPLLDGEACADSGLIVILADDTELAIPDNFSEALKARCVVALRASIDSRQPWQAQGMGRFIDRPVTAANLLQLTSANAEQQPPVETEWWRDGRFAGKRLLLVEDSRVNQELAKSILEDAEIEVVLADNGQQGLDQLQSQSFDLVLMDIQMPVMDGLTACRAIRAQSQFQALPVIALTAHALKDEHQRSYDAGMNAHVTKPIDDETLFKVLAELLL